MAFMLRQKSTLFVAPTSISLAHFFGRGFHAKTNVPTLFFYLQLESHNLRFSHKKYDTHFGTLLFQRFHFWNLKREFRESVPFISYASTIKERVDGLIYIRVVE